MNRLHQNQKGRCCGKTGGGRQKLLKLILAGLLLGGFAAPAYAADPAEETGPAIQFHGFADGNGDPDLSTDSHASNPLIPDKENITGIDVAMYENGGTHDTTSALTFSKEGAKYEITGKVHVVNTVTSSGNNDAIYAMSGTNVTIGGAGSKDHIYLASIAQNERFTLSFEDTVEKTLNASLEEYGLSIGAHLEEVMNSVMSSMQNGSSVLAAKEPLRTTLSTENTITVSGDHVQLIGNLDFLGRGTNTINANLNTENSFWYGDESNVPTNITISIENKDYQWMEGTINGAINAALTGKLESMGLKPGTLNVKLSNGAEWIYNANPSISALTMDGGIVNLQDDDIKEKYGKTEIVSKTPDRDENGDIKTDPVTGETIMKDVTYTLSDYRSDSPHTYVDIGTLKGSGIFKADIDWIANQGAKEETKTEDGQHFSDYIYIEKFEDDSAQTRSSESEEMPMQTLSFDESKAHLEDMKAGDKLYFATVSGNTGFKTEHSVYSNAANVFNYHYQASGEPTSSEIVALSGDEEETEKSQNWYIEVTGKTAEDNANFTAARSLMEAGYAMGTELDTLNKRMGEARYLDSDQGLWVRYRHGRSSRDDSYKTDSDMLQLGYDRKTDAGNGTHHRGVAFDYTDADTSLYQLSGSGDVDRYALSLYDTWMGNKGHYYDFVIRGGRINSGYDISGRFSTGMESMDNSYHQWFGSVSFEYGRKKDMSGSWYIEPQAQLQLARIGGASFTSASGVRTELDGTTSLIGRAGFRLGREFGSEGNDRNTFYIKADILHEFAGDRGFTLTGNDGWYAQNDNGTDTWYDVGIGVDLSLGHSTYFWTDVERILGSDFDNTWQVSGGLRWKW